MHCKYLILNSCIPPSPTHTQNFPKTVIHIDFKKAFNVKVCFIMAFDNKIANFLQIMSNSIQNALKILEGAWQ